MALWEMRRGSLAVIVNVLEPHISLPVPSEPNYWLTLSAGIFAGEIKVTLAGANTVVSIFTG